ncbi:MAG: hypothetical protein AAF636_08135 [Pseudomonadota bacterium]
MAKAQDILVQREVSANYNAVLGTVPPGQIKGFIQAAIADVITDPPLKRRCLTRGGGVVFRLVAQQLSCQRFLRQCFGREAPLDKFSRGAAGVNEDDLIPLLPRFGIAQEWRNLSGTGACAEHPKPFGGPQSIKHQRASGFAAKMIWSPASIYCKRAVNEPPRTSTE